MNKWRLLYCEKRQLQTKGQLVGFGKRRDLLSKAWYGLRKYRDVKLRAAVISSAMDTHHVHKVLAKCIKAWKRSIPSLRMKRRLREELGKDYSLRLKTKVFKAFSLHGQYRVERKETDIAMTKAVQEIGLKKFFRYWRSLASKRMGLLIFASTFEKLEVGSFFKRGRRMMLYEEESHSHMNLLREYHCL